MNIEELPEDSDSSDEDYVPDSKAEEPVSEEDSDGLSEGPLLDCEEETKNKRRKLTKKVKQKKKARIEEDKPNVQPKNEHSGVTEEEKKKKDDDLWADFMKDTGFKPKSTKAEFSSKVQSKTQNTSNKQNISNKVDDKIDKLPPTKVKVTQVFEFAGEEVKVEKEVDSNSAEARLLSRGSNKSSQLKKSGNLSGIGNVLSQLGKKQKINTLEKSKLDWDKFKKEENIEEELETHNKGKDGYLDKQDFLQRADLRRFEIERDIRNTERTKRFNSAL